MSKPPIEDLFLTILETLTGLDQRQVRIETRLSKLLIRMGMKPDGSGPLNKEKK